MAEKGKYKMRVVKQKVDSGDAAQADTDRPVVVGPTRARDNSVPVQEQVSKSTVHYVNWEYPGAREDWPLHMAERHVARMYPYALPSRLLVDFADTEEEKFICSEKAKRIRKRGLRYLIVSNGMTLEQALEQLGETGAVDNRDN